MPAVPEQLPLFVFGTLRRGHRNYRLLAGRCSRMTPAVLRGFARLHPLMIARQDGAEVDGELYEVRPEAWTATIRDCDDLEGIAAGCDAGTDYRRLRVEVETPDGPRAAWAYVHPATRDPDPGPSG